MTLLDPDLRTPSLSHAMKQGSALEHREAEQTPFTAGLLGGTVNELGYVDYLRRLRMVYATLERELRAGSGDPLVAAVHDPALERLASIDADLAHWAPGAEGDPHSPAAQAYCDRIVAAREWGGLLVAHHYTRYLGDLSGGQAIGRTLDRTFELGGRGLSFYVFTAIPKPKPYKDRYRARLDDLALSPAEVARIVDEVKAAFRCNQALFAELGEGMARYAR